MKILLHSNAPWAPSGYGQQARLLLPRLRDLGHEVACSAFYGLSGGPITWEGIPVYPAGTQDFGTDVLAGHANDFGADLVITLMDFWKLAPCAGDLARAPFRLAAWLPVDCTPLGRPDAQVLAATRARPIAMSRFGLRVLQEAGFGDALYAPHAVDTVREFRPPADREAFREQIGVAGRFVIGICAANKDALRKAWPEQFRAFARFREKHGDALLMVHSIVGSPGGFDLAQLADDLGILEHVRFTDQYWQAAGMMPPQAMADWYGALDILSCCSYAEAFGVPIIEAQACGTPVVVTHGSAMTELAGAGQTVGGSEFWNPVHRAWWVRPDVGKIVRRYEQAEATGDIDLTGSARALALDYDADRVAAEYWKPLLEQIEAE